MDESLVIIDKSRPATPESVTIPAGRPTQTNARPIEVPQPSRGASVVAVALITTLAISRWWTSNLWWTSNAPGNE